MDISCTPDNFSDAIESLYAKEQVALEKCVDEASKVALGRSYVDSKKIVKDQFDMFIDQFYEYPLSPVNTYQRSMDMYNVLKLTASEKNMDFRYEWDEEAMNQFERNHTGSLAEYTIGYGMHGGASSTKPDNAGRVVSGYHYRFPRVEYTNKNNESYVTYPFWGGLAGQETESPYDKFMKWFESYFSSSKYQSLYNKHFQSAIIELTPKYMGSI